MDIIGSNRQSPIEEHTIISRGSQVAQFNFQLTDSALSYRCFHIIGIDRKHCAAQVIAEDFPGYGINAEGQKIAANLLGTSAVSFLGRRLAASLIRVIPLAGNIFNATVNTTVAASVTAVLGLAIALVCEQYLAACVDSNGAENLPFAQYMNSERLMEAVKYVNDHKKELNFQEIIMKALKTGTDPEV